MSGGYLSTASRLRAQGHFPTNVRRGVPAFAMYDGPDLTATLPNEILLNIFGYLDARSLDNCSLVSRRWYKQWTLATKSRGPRHIRLLFEIVGGDTEDGDMDIYWLFKNDSPEVVISILLSLSSTYRLSRLASLEQSFEGSFESEIAALMRGDSHALMAVQLRTSSYFDTLNRPERELTNLIIRPPNPLNAMTDGVMTKIGTRLLREVPARRYGVPEVPYTTGVSTTNAGPFLTETEFMMGTAACR